MSLLASISEPSNKNNEIPMHSGHDCKVVNRGLGATHGEDSQRSQNQMLRENDANTKGLMHQGDQALTGGGAASPLSSRPRTPSGTVSYYTDGQGSAAIPSSDAKALDGSTIVLPCTIGGCSVGDDGRGSEVGMCKQASCSLK